MFEIEKIENKIETLNLVKDFFKYRTRRKSHKEKMMSMILVCCFVFFFFFNFLQSFLCLEAKKNTQKGSFMEDETYEKATHQYIRRRCSLYQSLLRDIHEV